MIYMKMWSELWHTLDVLIGDHEDVEMQSQPNVKSMVAYVEVGESRISKVHLLVH